MPFVSENLPTIFLIKHFGKEYIIQAVIFATRSTAIAVKPRSRANSVKERRLDAEQ
jgi:hypothetical protein